MKKTIKFCNIYLLLVASFLMPSLSAQNTAFFCGTTAGNQTVFPPTSGSFQQNCVENCSVNVCFHIIRRSDGSGGITDAQLLQVRQILNSDFNWFGINFNYLSNRIIQSDTWFNANDIGAAPGFGSFDALIQVDPNPNAINIYLGPKENDGKGQAGTSPSRSMVLTGSASWAGVISYYPITHAISHEMGHCLGLLHTFRGSPAERTVGCAEKIDGSNGTTCGDLVADTPADGVAWRNFITTGCYFNNTTVRDPNNQLYSITPVIDENIMAYLPNQCMAKFTYGQYDRMVRTIKTNPILQGITNCQQSGASSYLKIPVNDNMNISLFPNPTTELINITPSGFMKNVTVILTDITGKETKHIIVETIAQNSTYSLNISDIKSGIYVIKIKYGEHETMKKIVKF
jgi:Secretion system C-terminal sorting domain/Pregnancy-associated plasma protein-A